MTKESYRIIRFRKNGKGKLMKLMPNKTIVTILLTASWLFIGKAIANKKVEPPPVMVEATVIKEAKKEDKITATGSLLAIPGTIVKPEISGRVTKVSFTSGQLAKAGDVLVEINPDIIKAQYDAALAQLNLSKLNYDRSSQLYKTNDISKSDFDQAEASYNSDSAKLEEAKHRLEQTTVTAPFSGKLGLSLVSIGDYINAGQELVSLQTIDPIKVDFSVPEAYQSMVKISQQVSIHSDAYPNEVFKGSVEAIEALINPKNRTLAIRASIPNPQGKLVAGGFVQVALLLAEKSAILIPQTAIIYTADGHYVYKVMGNAAERVKVELAEKSSDDVEIKSGIKEGDIIVTAGQSKIYPGAKISIINDDSETSQPKDSQSSSKTKSKPNQKQQNPAKNQETTKAS
jgi:RND family efflux transporter, MFP subunit